MKKKKIDFRFDFMSVILRLREWKLVNFVLKGRSEKEWQQMQRSDLREDDQRHVFPAELAVVDEGLANRFHQAHGRVHSKQNECEKEEH